jgi:hypothetical protein
VRQSGDLAGQCPQHPDRVRADFPGDHDELDHIEPALAALILGDERLRLAETLG